MRRVLLGTALLLAAAISGCGATGPSSCEEWGLSPGTPQFDRCHAAQANRQTEGTQGAIEALRSIDAMGGMRAR